MLAAAAVDRDPDRTSAPSRAGSRPYALRVGHLDAGDAVLVAVEAHLLTVLGEDSGRAGVTFLGVERIDLLRFGPSADGLIRYVTLGMSRAPMSDSTVTVVDPAAPRAELVLELRGYVDTVLRRLAVLAASPAVEGVVVAPDALLDLGEPLWDEALFPAVLVGEPSTVPDLPLGEPSGVVRFLPVVPVTAEEAAFARVHGAAELRRQWALAGTDLTDSSRRGVLLRRPDALG